MIHYLLYGVFAFIILLAIYILYLAFDNKNPTTVVNTTNINPSINPYLPNNANQIPINNQVYNNNYSANPNNINYNSNSVNSNPNNTLGFNTK